MARIVPLSYRNRRALETLLRRVGKTGLVHRLRGGNGLVLLTLEWLVGAFRLHGLGLPAVHVVVGAAREAPREALGAAWLVKEGVTTPRWRIDQLIMDPGASPLEVGTPLVHYVVSHYGAQGAQTFVAWVNHQYDEALALLKACGFRQVAVQTTYALTVNHPALQQRAQAVSVDHWQELTLGDSGAFHRLWRDCLPEALRPALLSTPLDVGLHWARHSLRQWGSPGWSRRWGLWDTPPGGSSSVRLLMACVELTCVRQGDYRLRVLVHPGWPQPLEELVLGACQKALRGAAAPRVVVDVLDFEKLLDTCLKHLDAQWITTTHVLEKPYWQKELLAKPAQATPILLLGGGPIRPASS